MSISREEIRVQIIFPNRTELVLWVHEQFEMGRHIPFLVVLEYQGQLPMICAKLVKYFTQSELDAMYQGEE